MKEQRRMVFEAIVLQALWTLVMLAYGRKPHDSPNLLRGHMVDYMDEHGKQGTGAKAYRRERTYPFLSGF